MNRLAPFVDKAVAARAITRECVDNALAGVDLATCDRGRYQDVYDVVYASEISNLRLLRQVHSAVMWIAMLAYAGVALGIRLQHVVVHCVLAALTIVAMRAWQHYMCQREELMKETSAALRYALAECRDAGAELRLRLNQE